VIDAHDLGPADYQRPGMQAVGGSTGFCSAGSAMNAGAGCAGASGAFDKVGSGLVHY
jgi:hypothetical protein